MADANTAHTKNYESILAAHKLNIGPTVVQLSDDGHYLVVTSDLSDPVSS